MPMVATGSGAIDVMSKLLQDRILMLNGQVCQQGWERCGMVKVLRVYTESENFSRECTGNMFIIMHML